LGLEEAVVGRRLIAKKNLIFVLDENDVPWKNLISMGF
jgi:hypothetical protein